MIKVISFDFDGTIANHTFANAFWLEGIPLLYAKRHQIDVEIAKKYLRREYDKIGDNRIEWYDPVYWFNRFDLRKDWKKILLQYRKNIEIYPEVPSVLKRLSTNYDIIISSNAKKEFIELQLSQSSLDHYFDKIFSSTSDFHMIKKKINFYAIVCKKMKITPYEMIHVGDNIEFDYICPKKIGIISFYLDRNKTIIGTDVIHDLTQLEEIIIKCSSSDNK